MPRNAEAVAKAASNMAKHARPVANRLVIVAGDAEQDEQADLRPYDTPQHDRRRPAAVPEKETPPQTDGKAEIEQRGYSQQRKSGPDRQRCQFELPLCRCTGNDPQLEQVVTFEPFQPQPDSLGRDIAGRSKSKLPADMPFVRKGALGHRLRYLDPVLVLEIYIELFETRDLNSKRAFRACAGAIGTRSHSVPSL